MGSGSGGSYSGTNGGSQPYADKYDVVQSMLNRDKKDSDIYSKDTGYFKNPSAVNLKDSISGNYVVFEDNHANGQMTYVLSESGNIIFGKRCNPNDARKRSPHPTLVGGKNPKVQCAGMIEFRNGKWFIIDGYIDNNNIKKSTNGTWIYAFEDILIKNELIFKSNNNLFICSLENNNID